MSAIDDRAAKELGGIDFPLRFGAQTVDKLFAMGARRVFFDRAYADPTTPAEDATFISALKRHTGRVFLGVISIKDTRTKQTVEIGPRREFMNAAQLTSLNGKITPFSLSALQPYLLDNKDFSHKGIRLIIPITTCGRKNEINACLGLLAIEVLAIPDSLAT